MVGVGLALLLILGFALYGANAARKSFRRMLPGELQQWLDEGILGETEADRLRERYRLDQIAQESQNTIVKTIFGFGAVLIALGIIAFVAAHWEAISKIGRLSLVVGAMLAAHGAGFWLWRRRPESPLGHALVILGTLIFGANIALVAQVFHLSGEFYEGTLLWTVGATIMGYAVASSPHLGLAVIASFIGYMGWLGDYPHSFPIFFVAPLLVFLPYAFLNKSRAVHFLTWLFWGAGLITYLASLESSPFWIIGCAAATAIFFWNYGHWHGFKQEEFAADIRFLGVLAQAILLYTLSFHEIVEDIVSKSTLISLDWQMVLGIALGIIALTSWIMAFRRGEKSEALGNSIFAGTGLLMILIVLPGFNGDWAMPIGTLIANFALVMLGGFLFWKGLSLLDRRYFWVGLLLLVLEVVSRFFEYEAGLLWKSAAFILAGVLLIAGGIFFEQRRGRELKS